MSEQLWSDERLKERAEYWQTLLYGHANFDSATWIEAAMQEVRDEYEAKLPPATVRATLLSILNEWAEEYGNTLAVLEARAWLREAGNSKPVDVSAPK